MRMKVARVNPSFSYENFYLEYLTAWMMKYTMMTRRIADSEYCRAEIMKKISILILIY